MPVEKQVMIIYAVSNGYTDDVPVNSISSVEEAFHKYMDTNNPEIGKAIASEQVISDDTEEKLKKAVTAFKQTITIEGETCILPGEKRSA